VCVSDTEAIEACIRFLDDDDDDDDAVVVRLYQSLGCPHGCRDGIKGAQGDDVRAQARSFLQRLSNLDAAQFSRYIQRSLLAQPLQAVIDQLHALVGFCAEPPVLQSGRPTSTV